VRRDPASAGSLRTLFMRGAARASNRQDRRTDFALYCPLRIPDALKDGRYRQGCYAGQLPSPCMWQPAGRCRVDECDPKATHALSSCKTGIAHPLIKQKLACFFEMLTNKLRLRWFIEQKPNTMLFATFISERLSLPIIFGNDLGWAGLALDYVDF
jgi:hypothetical protein